MRDMCRLAAYLGPEIPLGELVLAPPHGLVRQALAPRELRHASLNADGFGFGWYAPDDEPAVYLSTLPIWSDPNLGALARSLRADLWLAFVRAATPGQRVCVANTQPFHDDALLFAHNGFVREFATRVRPALRRALAPEIEAHIEGTTDSEYLFALLRQVLHEDADLTMEEALRETVARVARWADGAPALLNLVVADGECLYALRHAVGEPCPSLYYTTDDERFPEGQLVASEPLTDAGYWRPVPEHHVLVLDPEQPPELVPL